MNLTPRIASGGHRGAGSGGVWQGVWKAGSGPANPWVLISLLTVAGWFIDSLVTAFQMHQAQGDDLSVHLYHFWYFPPLIVVALLLGRKRLRFLGARVTERPTLDTLALTLRPQVRSLALQVLSSREMPPLLALLMQHPGSSMTANDLALTLGKEIGAVEKALARLQELGLVETLSACDLTFYKLTSDAEMLAYLDELEAWRADWLTHAGRLAEATGVRLRVIR